MLDTRRVTRVFESSCAMTYVNQQSNTEHGEYTNKYLHIQRGESLLHIVAAIVVLRKELVAGCNAGQFTHDDFDVIFG